jgi:hypothetical protein
MDKCRRGGLALHYARIHCSLPLNPSSPPIHTGHRALAIDLVPTAIEQGRALEASLNAPSSDDAEAPAAAAAVPVEWVAGDMFSVLLPEVRKDGLVNWAHIRHVPFLPFIPPPRL